MIRKYKSPAHFCVNLKKWSNPNRTNNKRLALLSFSYAKGKKVLFSTDIDVVPIVFKKLNYKIKNIDSTM